MPSIVQSSFRSTSQKFVFKGNDENDSKIPLQKSANELEKKIKKKKPIPTFKFYAFSKFETRWWKVIFPPFFRATWHSESKSIWAKRTQCAKLLAYRAHGSFQFSPPFLLPSLPSRPSIFQSSCRIHFQPSSFPPPPPFLLLLFLLSSFFARANAISICRWYSVVASRFHGNLPNERSRWLGKRVINYAHARQFELESNGGQLTRECTYRCFLGLNVSNERDTLNKTERERGKFVRSEYICIPSFYQFI